MKKMTLITMVTVAVFHSGCNKRKYPPEQQFIKNEVFRMDAMVDNREVSLKAGKDSYYCYSSFTQATGGVYQFTSELKRYNCNPCPESFFLQVNDMAPRPSGAPVLIDSIIRQGAFRFARGMDYVTSFRLAPVFNKPASAWLWDFGDGTTSTDEFPEHAYTLPGKYTVCLKGTASSGCNDVTCNTLNVFEDGSVFFAGIAAEEAGAQRVNLAAVVQGKEPFTYTWHYGDGSTGTGATAQHTYKWPGSYPVRLFVKDAAGNSAESHYNYVSSGDQSSCAANFGVSGTNAVFTALSEVRLRWTDKNNRVFVSDRVQQPSASYFRIISVENYKPNKSGDLTKLITVDINVLLTDGSRELWLKADKAVLAVAYK